MPLTENQLRALKPKGKPYKVADEWGLDVEMSQTGGKLWRFRYRIDHDRGRQPGRSDVHIFDHHGRGETGSRQIVRFGL